MEKTDQKVKVILTDEIATGRYVNNVLINFSKTEFIFDFGLFQPQNSSNKIQSRVVMHPDNVQALIHTLQRTMKLYHQQSEMNIKENSTIQ